MIDNKNVKKAVVLKEDLEYRIEDLKIDGLDYMKVEDIEKVKDKVTKDIEEYWKRQSSICPSLQVGAIIRISDGDGVSYSQRDYYKIIKISESHIYFDQIIVVNGEYGNKIDVDRNSNSFKDVWIKRYNQKHHKDDISEEEWDGLIEYSEKIPWPKEKEN